MLSWLLSRPRQVVKLVKARYDSAATTRENIKHWANADGLSANSANSHEVRRTLRNRARYEVANNSYAAGIIQTLANDVIGPGPSLQLHADNRTATSWIEYRFSQWAKAVDLPAKLRTMRAARAVDGEAFAMMVSNPQLPTPVKLDLRLIEADQITTPTYNYLEPYYVDGIEYDAAGNPVTYHMLRVHPGERYTSIPASNDFDRIAASQVIHWFRADRPGQVRGVPEITSALPLFAQLRRYTLAVLAAAETAANFSGVLYTDAPAGGESDSAEPFETLEIERNMWTTMPAGWKMGQLKAEHPTTTYAEFKTEILNEIARCLNMPSNIARADSSSYNYASGRLDHQTYDRSLAIDQASCDRVILDRLLLAWLDEAALIPGEIPGGMPPINEWRWEWHWKARPHVDPQKEAAAEEIKLANHTTTLASIYARDGKDWETELRQRAVELQLMRELGIPTPDDIMGLGGGGGSNTPAGNGFDDDEEAEFDEA